MKACSNYADKAFVSYVGFKSYCQHLGWLILELWNCLGQEKLHCMWTFRKHFDLVTLLEIRHKERMELGLEQCRDGVLLGLEDHLGLALATSCSTCERTSSTSTSQQGKHLISDSEANLRRYRFLKLSLLEILRMGSFRKDNSIFQNQAYISQEVTLPRWTEELLLWRSTRLSCQVSRKSQQEYIFYNQV